MSKVFTYTNLSDGERIFLADPHVDETKRDDSGYQYFNVYDDEYLENKIGLLGMSATGTVSAMWDFNEENDARKKLSAIMRLALPQLELPLSLDQLTDTASGYFPVIQLHSNGAVTYDPSSRTIHLPAGETPENFIKNTVFGGKMNDKAVRMTLLTYGYLEGLEDQFDDFRFLSIEISDKLWPISKTRVARAYHGLVDEGLLVPFGKNTSSGFPSFTRIPSHARQLIEKPSTTNRRGVTTASVVDESHTASQYITEYASRNLITSAKARGYNTSKLEALVKEINDAAAKESAHSAHALIRSLLDHIAPLFGYDSFTQVVNNHKWSVTDRKRIKEINTLFRFDADDSLHSTISKRDTSIDMHSIGLIRKSINVILEDAATQE